MAWFPGNRNGGRACRHPISPKERFIDIAGGGEQTIVVVLIRYEIPPCASLLLNDRLHVRSALYRVTPLAPLDWDGEGEDGFPHLRSKGVSEGAPISPKAGSIILGQQFLAGTSAHWGAMKCLQVCHRSLSTVVGNG